jgi:lipopolysaccharide transport system ATP-binding protein
MTAEVVISAEGLGKKYVIGHQSERARYTALRDVITRATRNLMRATGDGCWRRRRGVLGAEGCQFRG